MPTSAVAKPDEVPKDIPHTSAWADETTAGLLAGALQTVIFNPMDRAMFLHVVNHTKYFDISNWRKPYQGVGNAVVSRTVSYGLYYSMLDFWRRVITMHLIPEPDEQTKKNDPRAESRRKFYVNTLTGIAVGINTSIIINPMSAVKYHSWGRDDRSLRAEWARMYKEGGMKPFTNGMLMTICRDSVFSIFFANLMPKVKEGHRKRVKALADKGFEKTSKERTLNWVYYVFLQGFTIAFATIFSSPLNYMRTHRFRSNATTKSYIPPDSVPQIIRTLCRNTMAKPTIWERVRFVQHQFVIGWGTLRVAVGMTIGQVSYDWVLGVIQKRHRLAELDALKLLASTSAKIPQN